MEKNECHTLTHWGRVTHICVANLTIIDSDNGAKPLSNQCWNIVKWTLGNQLQWNSNLNSSIFIHENGLESVVCEMAAILSRPQCVKKIHIYHCFTMTLRCGIHCHPRLKVHQFSWLAYGSCIQRHWGKISDCIATTQMFCYFPYDVQNHLHYSFSFSILFGIATRKISQP